MAKKIAAARQPCLNCGYQKVTHDKKIKKGVNTPHPFNPGREYFPREQR